MAAFYFSVQVSGDLLRISSKKQRKKIGITGSHCSLSEVSHVFKMYKKGTFSHNTELYENPAMINRIAPHSCYFTVFSFLSKNLMVRCLYS